MQIRDSKQQQCAGYDPSTEPMISLTLSQFAALLSMVSSGAEFSDACPVLIHQQPDGAATIASIGQGVSLAYTGIEWDAFTAGVRDQEFDKLLAKPLAGSVA